MTATQIDVAPLFLNNYTLVIDSDSYEKAISSATFTPSSKIVSFQGGTPDASFNFPTPATWTCDLEFAQDWTTTGSLSQYLHTNEGLVKPCTFVPNADGPTVAANIIVTPGAIGGGVGTVGTAKVSLGVNGKPTIQPASGGTQE